MNLKTDIVQEFNNYVLSLINNVKPVKFDATKDSMIELLTMIESFKFLSRFENEEDFRKYINISEVFDNSIFYETSYHEDTNEYNALVQQYNKIKTLSNNEKLFIDGVDDNLSMVRNDAFFIREDRIVHKYNILYPIEKIQKRSVLYEQPIKIFPRLKDVPGIIFNEKGFVIPKKCFRNNINNFDSLPDSIFGEIHGNKILFYDDIVDEKFNFFDKKLFKLYNKDGEILDYENIDYYEILYKLRNCIAHDSIKICKLENSQIINIAKLDENLVIVMLDQWYAELLALNKFENKSYFRFLDIPKINKVITTKSELEQHIDNFQIIEIILDNYGSTVSAFNSLIKKYISIYNDDSNIKKSRSEYVGNMILKFYDNFDVNIYNIENKDIIKYRLLNDKSFYNIGLDKIKTIKTQNSIIQNVSEVLYKDSLDLKNRFNINNYLYSTDQISYILFECISAFCEFAKFGKNKNINKFRGYNVELAIMLSQFLIYGRLIYGNFCDKLKTINSDDVVELDYYNTENGKLRLEINKLKMNKFTIIDLKKPINNHGVESFRDKILTLRLLRNAVAHGNFCFQLSKNVEPLETVLVASSNENENIKVKVKISDLINLLNEELFIKYTYKSNNSKFELSKDEMTNYLKQLF